MSIPIFPPRRDGDLLRWSAAFNGLINATPLAFGLTAGQASAYTALHDAYASAYAKIVNPNTNTKSAVAGKNTAREALMNDANGARALVRIIQAYPGTTNDDRAKLALRIADDTLTPINAPRSAPQLTIRSTHGRVIKVRLRDQSSPTRRGKPPAAQGAVVLYHIGDAPPSQPELWTFGKLVSRNTFDFQVPGPAPAGSQVWLTAFWFNARKDQSPAATAKCTCIGQGLARAA